MKASYFLLTIVTLFVCCQSLKTGGTPYNDTSKAEDALCPALQEFEIIRTFSSKKTNLPSVNAILPVCANGVSATMYKTQTALENGIENHLKEFEEYYGAIKGRDYIKQELIKRISEKVDFKKHHLILVTVNSGGPPFHTLKCTIENGTLLIEGVKPKSVVSGMALMMNTRFFNVPKKLKMK